MPKQLLIVEQRVWIRGKGLMLSPGIVASSALSAPRAGESVELRRPDGTVLDVLIQGTRTDTTLDGRSTVRLLLAVGGKDDVPIGTEVWTTL